MDETALHRLLHLRTWQQVFETNALLRGFVYAAQGKVRSLSVQPVGPHAAVLTAQVRGRARQDYVCRIAIQAVGTRLHLGGDCTCPMARDCKHVVAALTVAGQEPPGSWPRSGGDVLPAPAAAPAPAPAPAPDNGLAPWRDWLEQLQQPPGPGRGLGRARAGDVFALLLRAGSGAPWPRLLVAPVWLSPGKTKPWVSPRNPARGPYGPTPAPAQGWPEGVLESLVLLGDCPVERAGSLHWSRLDSAYHDRALATLVRQVPVHFERAGAQPLRIADERPLDLHWRMLDDGSQRLQARVAGAPRARLLRGDGLWFLDEEQGCFGRIDAEPRLVAALAAAPALSIEQAAGFDALLENVALPVALPRPAQPRPARQVRARPVVVLSLRQVSTAGAGGTYWYARERGLPPELGVASMAFDYGGVRVSVQPGPPRERHTVDGELVEVLRDDAAEHRVLAPLAALPLARAGLLASAHGLYALPLVPDDLLLKLGASLAAPVDWQPYIDALEAQGVRFEFEGDFPYRRLVEAGDWHAELERSGNAWFDLRLGIDIDGERVDLLPILRRVLADPAFPLQRGKREKADAAWTIDLDEKRQVRLPLARLRDLAAPLLEWLEGDQGDHLRLHRSQAENLARLADGAVLPWRGNEALRRELETLRAAANLRPKAPAGFRGKLRPYQRDGLAWLAFLDRAGLGGVLADDMGLGKTVQVLAHLQAMRLEGRLAEPALIVCPTSLVGNWRDEAARFAPGLRCLVLHGADRADHHDRIADSDLVITTYPLLPRDREHLMARSFSLLVLDEAQAIKNARSQAAQVVREIPVGRRLAMTGTPLENHLGELWAQFDAVEPGLLGSERQFTRLYRTPIEKRGDGDRRERLARRIGPLLLRRRKEDVLTDLPAKTEIVRMLDLEGDQRSLYEALRLAQHERVKQAVATRGLAQSGIVVLDALLKLRQACCDPRLVKLDSARRRKTSVKLDALVELVTGLVDEGRRILVFSQFAEMLALIEQVFAKAGVAHQTLTGQTPGTARASLVRRFQDGAVPVFLISLKAGGVGLNLTAADTVIHYDPWWNPAVEAQATDRAHRIGQDKPVFVYKLLCAGTVEEKIQALQARKAELARAVLEGGSTRKLRFDEADLEALFAPL